MGSLIQVGKQRQWFQNRRWKLGPLRQDIRPERNDISNIRHIRIAGALTGVGASTDCTKIALSLTLGARVGGNRRLRAVTVSADGLVFARIAIVPTSWTERTAIHREIETGPTLPPSGDTTVLTLTRHDTLM